MHDRLYIIETLSKFAAILRANVAFAAPCYMLSDLHSKAIVDCGKNWQGYYLSPYIVTISRMMILFVENHFILKLVI